MTTRRDFLKKAAAAAGVTGLAWVAPEIDTTVASAQALPHGCCACYYGDPPGQPGAFLAAGADHFTLAECVTFCEGAAPKGTNGVVLHFVSNPKHPFDVQGAHKPKPGCHYMWDNQNHWLDRVIVPPNTTDGPGYHSHCPPPSELNPLHLLCNRGYWKT